MTSLVRSDGVARQRFTFLTNGSGEDDLGSTLIKSLGTLGDNCSSEDQAVSDKIIELLKTENSVGFTWTPQEQNFIDNNAPDRWLEYLVYRYKFKVYPDQNKVTDFPIYLLIEPTSV